MVEKREIIKCKKGDMRRKACGRCSEMKMVLMNPIFIEMKFSMKFISNICRRRTREIPLG